MRAVVQRVTQASVTVDGELLGRIGKGFLILLGVADGDTRQMAEKMADKICRLRIFEDENGKTNLSLEDVEGELLVVSQFTLYADCRKGNRPSFIKAGDPQMAESLYKHFMERCGKDNTCHRLFARHGTFGSPCTVNTGRASGRYCRI